MDDIRLPETPFPFEGREYKLRCNFNVLAEVVEDFGGEMPDIFDKRTRLRVARSFLAAMLNDYADEQGWPERYTPRQLGRKLGGQVAMISVPVMNLVIRAVCEKAPATETEGEHPKN